MLLFSIFDYFYLVLQWIEEYNINNNIILIVVVAVLRELKKLSDFITLRIQKSICRLD